MTSPVAGFARIPEWEELAGAPPCGTIPAYRLHLKSGERCDPCQAAMAAYERERRHERSLHRDPGVSKIQSAAVRDRIAPVLDADSYPCAGDPDLWFSDRPADIKRAKNGCMTCPALAGCRKWALATGEEHGTWGALSERERRKIRRQAA